MLYGQRHDFTTEANRQAKGASTAAQALSAAGLDWNVSREIIYTKHGHIFKAVTGKKAIVRGDDLSTLSVMDDKYVPLQNAQAFDFFNPFIEQDSAQFEAAGSFKGGRIIWVQAELKGAPIEVGKGGDIIKKRILFATSHDGSMSNRVGLTPLRVSCFNSLRAAVDGKAGGQIFKVKHSNSQDIQLAAIQEALNVYNAQFEATAEQYNRMAAVGVRRVDLENYVNFVFDLTTDKPTDRELERNKAIQDTITALFENGAGAHLQSARGTMWGAYNAITEYLTHEAGKDVNGSRLNSNWFGENARTNQRAFEAAREFAYSI